MPTLNDKFGRPIRDLRISVMDKCNFRCPYCMPAEIFGEDYDYLKQSQFLSNTELLRLSRIFASLGVTKLRLTGGEPLLRKDIIDLIAQMTTIDGLEDLAMTTNAFYLAQHVGALKEAGLHRLTISLDSLDNDVFLAMNGNKATVEQVLAGIEAAEKAGFSPLKINCVVKRNVNEHTIGELAAHFRGSGHIVRFIEYMDVGNLNGWVMDDVVPAQEIIDIISKDVPLVPLEANYQGEVALRYGYENGAGEIGVIASVTKPFCGNCTRARLSAAGEYYTCLFGADGTDLRAALRSDLDDDAIGEIIAGVWRKRTDQYSELRTSFTEIPRKGAEMYRLGG